MPLGALQNLKKFTKNSLYFEDPFLEPPRTLMEGPKASPRSPDAHFVWKVCRNRDAARKPFERSLRAFGRPQGFPRGPPGEILASRLSSRVDETLGYLENVHFYTIK